MRRKILLAVLLLLLAAGAGLWWWTRPLPVLTVTTWAGVYGRAQAASQMLPYGAEHRVNVRIAQWADNGTLDELRQAVASGQASDVVDLELPVAVEACRQNLLEPIDAAALPPGADGTPATQDFYQGMLGRCFVASAIYAQMIVCEVCQSVGNLTELFGLVAAGERIALQQGAKVNLEMALLADGVPPGEVYAVLATPEGVHRAFAKLDTIKPNIVWWRGTNEPATLLRTQQVRIATVLTAEVQAMAQTRQDMPLFGPHFYEADVLAIPRGTQRKEMALDYIGYATGSAPLANMTRFAPFTPPRRSSRALVAALPAGPHRDFVHSLGDVLDRSFAIDNEWWREHGPALEARFRIWMGA